MRPNRLRTLWKSGGAAVNGWLAIPNGFSAETMAHQGWDSLTIDLQHGVIDYQGMIPMLQAISTTDTVPVVRVPWLEPSALMKALDAGAYAVICPMISTREDAQRLVAYTNYAPRGTRSFGPVRANLYGGPDYAQHADDTIVRFAMIETAQALDAGAYGVICPMINSREDAQKLVAWTHYAPRGTRSFGPVRALLYGGADYPQHANDTIVTFAMIETAAALDHLDDILSVEGLDAIYIGPSDLSLALGCKPTFDDLDPLAAQAVDHILARAKAHGVVAGIHNGGPEAALARIAKGFQFTTVSSDARLMAAGAQQVMAAMRAGTAPAAATTPTSGLGC